QLCHQHHRGARGGRALHVAGRRHRAHHPPPRYSVNTPSTASRNAPDTNSVILNRRSLAKELSMTATAQPTAVALASSAAMARTTATRRWVEARPHGARNP